MKKVIAVLLFAALALAGVVGVSADQDLMIKVPDSFSEEDCKNVVDAALESINQIMHEDLKEANKIPAASIIEKDATVSALIDAMGVANKSIFVGNIVEIIE